MSYSSKMYAAWLQSDRIDPGQCEEYQQWFSHIVASEASEVFDTAIQELVANIETILGITPQVSQKPSTASYIHIGTMGSADWSAYGVANEELAALQKDGYIIRSTRRAEVGQLLLIGGSDAGVLYGVFDLFRRIRTGQMDELKLIENPRYSIRMINQWDNVDGSIERGYAGKSIFYEDHKIVKDVTRVRDYARLLASVGINAISINNVNVHDIETTFITRKQLPDVARIADVFRAYGIKLFLSINFASPMQVGGLDTADPLDPKVKRWWADRAKDIYEYIPDFAGFLVKADSEHRPGPFSYGRDHADGANMLAEALEPYGGLVIWRCFVYNCMQDWRDRSTDRARAAYDHFKLLDGRFHDNVILQIKNGPMDFQVREPVSPLFGALEKTNSLLEFQITQEYTGQQRHLCYLVPQWKEVLDFDTHAKGAGSKVKNIVDGSLFGYRHNGIAAVSNIGNDENWTGHVLAQANLYGYGRLTWNPDLAAEDIAEEWVKQTFGSDQQVVDVICQMLMSSWPIYEQYTAPLGVGWMVSPNHHYGPDVDGYEYSRWGTYHFADRDGIGVDRTMATGTGYTAQYYSPNREMYDSLETCPDELLLFFHHVSYKHVLHSGKTVIQHIYDTHFEGVEQAEKLVEVWKGLEGTIDAERYAHVLRRQEEQAEHAKHWRDVINTYFYRKSGIPDAHNRKIY